MNRRRFLATAGTLLAAGCSRDGSDNRLVVGMELGYPPFEMRDEQGRPAGVSVDLATSLAQALQRELVIENIAFDGLIPALKTGKIDLILASMTRTEEREQSIAFSVPYAETGLCLLVGKDSLVQSIDDVDQPGRTVAVMKGTTGQAYAAAHIRHARVLVLDKDAMAVLEVVQGKADAFIFDQVSVYEHWKRNDATTRAILKPFQKEYWAIGLRKEDGRLKDQVNAFLGDFRRSGGFDRLGDRWLKEPRDALKEMGLVFMF